jgi:DNA-binding NarL/FixJ family response regulator
VLVISRHKRLRDGIMARLEEQSGVETVEIALTGKTALDKVRSLQPDVIVADQEHAFVARRATAILAGEGRSVKLILLSADGSRMVTRTVSESEPASWNRLMAAIGATPSGTTPSRSRKRIGGEN